MPRARWSLPADTFAGLYQDGYSLRQIQTQTGLPRDLITATLQKAGFPIRDREDAMRLRQRFASQQHDEDVSGQCALPGCQMSAPALGLRLCLECSARYAQAQQDGRCVWRACAQTAKDGACYAHRKRLDRLFS